jgi:glycosyltransferase involved in cell wall biosynthesis
MPSTSEPFGLVALEAIAHGTPVILSKQSGVREVVFHAFHVDFWDIEKLADCMMTVLREEPLAVQLRSEAASALHCLTWESQATKVMAIYNKVRLRA